MNPRYNPSETERQEISFMYAIGISQENIAAVKGVTVKTLRRACRKELTTAKTKVISAVASSLYKKAMGGNVVAQMFYLKTQAGWRETVVQEHTGPGGGPMVEVKCTAEEYAAALKAAKDSV